MRELRAVLEMKTDQVQKMAEDLCDEFIRQQKEQNAKLPKGQRSYLGCRVRKRDNSITMEWFYVDWAKKADGTRYTKYIKRGKGMTYKMDNLLKHAKPWEHELVRQTEGVFGMLRKMNRSLTGARRFIINGRKAEMQAHFDFLEGAANISWKIKELEEGGWDETPKYSETSKF